MKTELKRELFKSAKELTDFVNNNKITKENIQVIKIWLDTVVLFYWEVTE